MPIEFLLTILLAYLMGSINSAIIYSKIRSLPDPRTKGSHNPGATNIYRIAGKRAAAMVMIFDVLKGVIPTWGSYYLSFEPHQIGMVAIACCLGHMYPIFFRFQGGKAVATAFGCLLPVGLSLGASLLAIWLLVFRLTGFSSLSAIIAVACSPFITYLVSPKYTMAVGMLAVIIIARHSPNIIRLLNGTEPKSKLRL